MSNVIYLAKNRHRFHPGFGFSFFTFTKQLIGLQNDTFSLRENSTRLSQ